MRQENIDSDIVYGNAQTLAKESLRLKSLSSSAVEPRNKVFAHERKVTKDISIAKWRSIEKKLAILLFLTIFAGLFVILQGRMKTTDLSYKIDRVNSEIQAYNQENQDLNSEFRVLTNSSRLEKIAQEYGFQYDESRIQNVIK